MCCQADHDDLRSDWRRFEEATVSGFLQSCAGYVFEMRRCRRCGSSLSHPRDLARYRVTWAGANGVARAVLG